MIKKQEKTHEKHFCETIGLFYEEFEIGSVWEHRPGRTVTETDNILMSMMTMNDHPIHFDQHYASKTEFSRILVNSIVTIGIVSGMSVRSLSARCIANLGWSKIRLLRPVFIGDTLYAESKIISKRPSFSKLDRGIVKITTSGYNQNKELVLRLDRTFLVSRKKIENPE